MEKKEYIEEIKLRVKETAELFYQQKSAQGFAVLPEILTLFSNAASILYEWQNANEIKGFDLNQYLDKLTQAMNALENKDEVLLADILNYEITDVLETIEIC